MEAKVCEGTCNKSELFTALAKAQGAMRGATKDGANPHFRSKYATLDSVCDALRQPFADNGLFHSEFPSLEYVDGVPMARVKVVIGHSSGQHISATLSSALKDGTPQVFGSAISYLRRYGLMALSGLPAEDDDGEATAQRPGQAYKPKQSDSDLLASVMAYEVQVKKASREQLQQLLEKFKVEFEGVAVADRLRRACRDRMTELDKEGQ